jgi:hypothetical protein
MVLPELDSHPREAVPAVSDSVPVIGTVRDERLERRFRLVILAEPQTAEISLKNSSSHPHSDSRPHTPGIT